MHTSPLRPPALLRFTFAATLLFTTREAPAAPGDLDTSFGTGGKVALTFSQADFPNAMRVQPDGKILVAGQVNPTSGGANTGGDFGLVRLLPDGSLDKDFGSGGKVITDFGGEDLTYTIILQPDGRIILAGWYLKLQLQRSGLALARYLPNGQLDPSFGSGGKITTAGDGMNVAYDGVLQGDGTFLLAGTLTKDSVIQPVVARYSTGGVMDGTFGTGGLANADGILFQTASAIALQGTDRFIVAGNVTTGGPDDVGLARFDTAGHPDTTFGTGGRVVIDSGDLYDNLAGLIVSSDRKILVAGYNYGTTVANIFLLRFLPDGAPDNTFGTGGKVSIPSPDGEDETCHGVVMQPDGAIVIAAAGNTPTGFRLIRLHPDGRLDASFGTGGRAFTPGDAQGTCLALQSDGKVVVAGTFNDASFKLHIEVSRYEGTPPLTPLETWRQKWFGITTDTGNAADDFDYDGDGLANLIEWAAGLNPTSREASPITATLNGTDFLLTYPLSDTALNAGTTVTVEWTDDLSTPWHTDGIVTSMLSDDGSLRQMQAVLPAGTSGRRFVRLKASHP